MNKREIRKHYRSLRDAISKPDIALFSESICRKIAGTQAYKQCDTLLVFVSVGSEVDTSFIISDAFSEGKKVAVPKINGKEMSFVLISSTDELVDGDYNIPTAPEGNETVSDFSNTLCVVPCLSADESLTRIGYGGGFYDRFLSSHPDVKTICVCFDKCVGENLPQEEFDIPVDLCITETRVLGGVTDA